MPYELVTDHWIISVHCQNDHGSPYYDDDRYFFTEDDFKAGLEKVINHYYESVNHVSEVKLLKWHDEE